MKGTFDYVKTVPKSHFPRGLSPAGLNCAHFFQEFLLTSFLYYLLTENEVFTSKSQTETLRVISKAEVWYFPIKTERTRLISCLLYDFLLWFCRPVIGPWALRDNNALQLANQSAHYIGNKHKEYYYTLDTLSLFWLAESAQLIFEISACDVILLQIIHNHVKGTQGHG